MSVNNYFDWKAVKAKSPFCAKYVSLTEAIEKDCKDLGTLFRLWQTAQIYETDDESSFPNLSLAKCPKLSSSGEFKRSFRSSFCPDGFLSKEAKPEAPVLFICRESNISDNINNRTLKLKSADKQIFWLREVVRCRGGEPASYYINEKALTSEADKKDLSSAKRAQTKYYNCLSQLLDRLKEDEELIGEDEKLIDKKKKLSDCAYLNINKRGGFADCDLTRLATYAQRYQVFIQKEIQLINPEKIVVCGELKDQCLQDTLEEIFRNYGKINYWVYPKHPSRYTTEAFKNIVKSPVNRKIK